MRRARVTASGGCGDDGLRRDRRRARARRGTRAVARGAGLRALGRGASASEWSPGGVRRRPDRSGAATDRHAAPGAGDGRRRGGADGVGQPRVQRGRVRHADGRRWLVRVSTVRRDAELADGAPSTSRTRWARVQRRVGALEDHLYRLPGGGGAASHIGWEHLAPQEHLAMVGGGEPGDHPPERRLAAARLTDDPTTSPEPIRSVSSSRATTSPKRLESATHLEQGRLGGLHPGRRWGAGGRDRRRARHRRLVSVNGEPQAGVAQAADVTVTGEPLQHRSCLVARFDCVGASGGEAAAGGALTGSRWRTGDAAQGVVRLPVARSWRAGEQAGGVRVARIGEQSGPLPLGSISAA